MPLLGHARARTCQCLLHSEAASLQGGCRDLMPWVQGLCGCRGLADTLGALSEAQREQWGQAEAPRLLRCSC